MRVNAASFLILWPDSSPSIYLPRTCESLVSVMGLAKCLRFALRLLIHQTCKPAKAKWHKPTDISQFKRSITTNLPPLLAPTRFQECLNCSSPSPGECCALDQRNRRQDLRPTAHNKNNSSYLGAAAGLTIRQNILRPCICPAARCPLMRMAFGSA